MPTPLGLRLTALLMAGVLAPTAFGRDEPPAPTDPLISAMIEAHNVERAKGKLPPLRYASLLETAAKAHARDMADRDLMTHEGGDGSTPSQRIVRTGYHYLTAGENVAQGYTDVPKVMQGWMDSPPHKKNILGDFTEIGVAKVAGKDGKAYWCAEFGKPIPKFDPAEAAAELLKSINDERSAAKLAAITVDVGLARVARDQARALAKAAGRGGTTPSFNGIDQERYRELALTTAVGQPDPGAVLKTLLESPEHKDKLLGKFSKVGIGYATAEDGQPYWVVILGLPASR